MNFTKLVGIALLIVHGLLAVWAIVGFTELFFSTVPWSRISNQLFPESILFMQWLLTLAAAGIFIFGYIYKWHHTTVALVCAYTAMAALCAIETFGYLKHDSRFIEMLFEYITYAAILIFLFRSKFFQNSLSLKKVN
jgi:hypothetical protein